MCRADIHCVDACLHAQDVPNLKITMCPPTWKYLEHGSEHTYDHAVYQNDGEAKDPDTSFRALPVLIAYRSGVLRGCCEGVQGGNQSPV